MILKHTPRLTNHRQCKATALSPLRPTKPLRRTSYTYSPSPTLTLPSTASTYNYISSTSPSGRPLLNPATTIAHNKHTHTRTCTCLSPHPLLRTLSPCRLLPLQRFGTSLLPTPLIVLLRLFLPAASLAVPCLYTSRHTQVPKPALDREVAVGARLSGTYLRPRRLRREATAAANEDGIGEGVVGKGKGILKHLGRRVSTGEFVDIVKAEGVAGWRVVSVTWVKALASHMSHEFVQFVVEGGGGRRVRVFADRQETGDWVSVTPEVSGDEEEEGGEVQTPYQDRHMMPLPLVSVVFEADGRVPKLGEMAELLMGVSARCREYNPLREHCWWFSEAVLEGVRERWGGGRLEEWEWARYRYSFVICNQYIRRDVLERAARGFERRCLQALEY